MKFVHKIFLFLFYRVFMKNFLRLIIGVNFSNNKAFREHDQFLVLGNHNSHLDTMSILSSIPWRMLGKIHPVAAGDYFGRNPILSFLTKTFVNALLINRNKDPNNPQQKPIDVMDQYIKEGKSLLIFPEGSRGHPEKLQEFKAGAAILLSKNPNVPFIPVYMKGLGKVMPKGDGLLVPQECSIIIGDAVFPIGTVEEITGTIQSSILELETKQG